MRAALVAGNATGMYNSGFANEYGKGGPVDYEKAAQWYQKGASQGDGTSR